MEDWRSARHRKASDVNEHLGLVSPWRWMRVCLCVCAQEFVRISVTSVARRSHSAVRWSRTVARCTVASSTSRTNSDETRSTCARNAATQLVDRSCTTPTSSTNTRPVRRCFELTTSATSSSLRPRHHRRPTARRLCRAGTPRHL